MNSARLANAETVNTTTQHDSHRQPHTVVVVAGVLLMLVVNVNVSGAQDQLVARHSAGFGTSFESVQFGGSGLRQFNFNGLDSARISGVTQVSAPITGAWTLSDRWRVDVTALYARATVKYHDAATPARAQTATLSGVSDMRLRATGELIPDRLVLTAGINAPTGRTALTGAEFGVLRIVAAPGLGMGSTPVGAGASGTLGLVFARRLGPWSVAVGGSYEHRGTYQPVAALVAGSESAEFRPGGVFRTSVTGDRTVGAHRLTLAFAADVFAKDELDAPRNAVGGSTIATGASIASTTVRLGPVVSADAQMLLSVPRFRQFMAYSSFRWRAPFLRDGSTVKNSSGQYLDSGIRGALSLGPNRDFILGVDTRLHAGLGVDQGLPTSGVASGGLSAGVEIRRSLMFVQPYVRAQGGVLRQRGVGPDAPTQSFTGFGLGVVAIARF